MRNQAFGLVGALILFLVCVLACVPAALGQSDTMETFMDGVDALDEGNYKKALRHINDAIEAEPDNLEYRYYQGVIYEKLGEKEHAQVIFYSLVDAEPETYRKAYFNIAAIYSSQSQYEKAAATIEKAIDVDPGDARAYLELGGVYMDQKRYDEALAQFDIAEDLNPVLAPRARHLSAQVYLAKNDYDKAENLFREVAESVPATAVGQSSAKALESMSLARRSMKSWYVGGQFMVAYDDNVTQQPLDPRPDLVYTDKEDWFQTLSFAAGWRFINERKMRLGIEYALSTIGYKDYPENNVLTHNPAAFFELDRGRFHLRVQYDFGYYYTGGAERDIQDAGWFLTFASDDDKLKTHRVMPILSIDEPHGLRTELTLYWIDKQYFDTTPDADIYYGKLLQYWTFSRGGATARLGYAYYDEEADVDGYSYDMHEAIAGVMVPLEWDLVLDVSGAYLWTRYERNPILWSGEREDDGYRFAAYLTRPVTDWLNVLAGYQHSYNDSNTFSVSPSGVRSDLYEFRKNIFMFALSAQY